MLLPPLSVNKSKGNCDRSGWRLLYQFQSIVRLGSMRQLVQELSYAQTMVSCLTTRALNQSSKGGTCMSQKGEELCERIVGKKNMEVVSKAMGFPP